MHTPPHRPLRQAGRRECRPAAAPRPPSMCCCCCWRALSPAPQQPCDPCLRYSVTIGSRCWRALDVPGARTSLASCRARQLCALRPSQCQPCIASLAHVFLLESGPQSSAQHDLAWAWDSMDEQQQPVPPLTELCIQVSAPASVSRHPAACHPAACRVAAELQQRRHYAPVRTQAAAAADFWQVQRRHMQVGGCGHGSFSQTILSGVPLAAPGRSCVACAGRAAALLLLQRVATLQCCRRPYLPVSA